MPFANVCQRFQDTVLGSVSIKVFRGPGQFAALGGKAVPGMRPADSNGAPSLAGKALV